MLPIVRLVKARRAARERQQRREELQKVKQSAQSQQRMMRPLIVRMRAEEDRSNGLVIVKVRGTATENLILRGIASSASHCVWLHSSARFT